MRKNDLDLFVELVKTNFKLRYKGSILGFIWVLIKPFLIYLVLFVVFSNLGGSTKNLSSGEYSIYLLLGLIIFNYFNEGILWGMNSLLDKSHIILKVNFNRVIALVSSLALAAINVIINSFILLLASIVVGISPGISAIAYTLFLLIVSTLLIVGISFFSSIMLIRLRDLNHIAELGLQLLFYGSAVFYPIDIVPSEWQFLIRMNPVAVIIQGVRRALLFDSIVQLPYLTAIGGFSVLLCLAGFLYFKNNIKRVAEYF